MSTNMTDTQKLALVSVLGPIGVAIIEQVLGLLGDLDGGEPNPKSTVAPGLIGVERANLAEARDRYLAAVAKREEALPASNVRLAKTAEGTNEDKILNMLAGLVESVNGLERRVSEIEGVK